MNQRPKCKAADYKTLEENIGRALFDINHSNIFLIPSSRVMEVKTTINK